MDSFETLEYRTRPSFRPIVKHCSTQSGLAYREPWILDEQQWRMRNRLPRLFWDHSTTARTSAWARSQQFHHLPPPPLHRHLGTIQLNIFTLVYNSRRQKFVHGQKNSGFSDTMGKNWQKPSSMCVLFKICMQRKMAIPVWCYACNLKNIIVKIFGTLIHLPLSLRTPDENFLQDFLFFFFSHAPTAPILPSKYASQLLNYSIIQIAHMTSHRYYHFGLHAYLKKHVYYLTSKSPK